MTSRTAMVRIAVGMIAILGVAIPTFGSSEALMADLREDEEATSSKLDLDALDRVRTRPTLEATIGVWFPRLEGLVTLGSGGTALDAGDDLSLDDSSAIFNGEFEFEAGRWQILFGGYLIKAEDEGVLRQDSVVEGSTLAAGTTVGSRVEVWSINAEASWLVYTPFRERRTPWSNPDPGVVPDPVIDLSLQAVAGLRVINLEQRYDFEGDENYVSNRAWFCPYVGVGAQIDWSTRRSMDFLDRVVFDATAGWGPALSGGDSTFVVRADFTIYPIRNLGISLGYRLNDFTLSRDGDGFDGGLQGLFAGVEYVW